jgi:hypothetical protein
MKHAMIPDAHPFPAIDRNDPEKAKTAIMLEWPETFSDRAKMVIRYFDGTMFPYSYADHIVLTDESLELTAFGDGSPEAPIGFPRYEDNTLEGVEAWLEEVADQYDADGDIAGWEEAKLAYACEQKEAWAKKNLSKLARHGWKLLVDGKPTDFDESLWDRAIKSCRECGCNAIMYSVSRPETDEPSAIAIYKDGHVTERVNEHKSLVDLQLTAGVVTEPWKNNVDGFLLASSDSDFWGLIRSLPSARFMVLLEKDKYGEYLTDALKLNDIGYCIMDDFAGNVEDIKTGAMNKSIETYLAERVQLNVDEMLSVLYSELRIDMTEKQKRQFRERLLNNFRVKVDSSGELNIRVD